MLFLDIVSDVHVYIQKQAIETCSYYSYNICTSMTIKYCRLRHEHREHDSYQSLVQSGTHMQALTCSLFHSTVAVQLLHTKATVCHTTSCTRVIYMHCVCSIMTSNTSTFLIITSIKNNYFKSGAHDRSCTPVKIESEVGDGSG